ncbi:hypothetical protein RRG08_007198 [Elysia crispata]|uniref:Zinc finger protein 865 n=1 Tax=Elysia crispata TaxID=231223 RepID=A0AAE1E946_9GAST|nr:hypothetical protein RRG08_007198 [Elysia crispata]
MEQDSDGKGADSSLNQEKIFPCLKCGKGFKRKEHLQGHEERMHGAKSLCSFECRWCGQQFRHKGHWKRHEDLHNSGPLRCLNCAEKFNSGSELKDHYREKHARPKSCLMCKEVFYSKEALMLHVKSCAQSDSKLQVENLDKTVKSKVCPICKISIVNPSNHHLSQLYYEGKKQSVCQKCASAKSIEDNSKVTNGVPFGISCLVCSEHFSSSEQLVFHKVQAHDDKGAIQELLKLSRSLFENSQGPEAKSKDCPICQKHFPCPAKLRIHLNGHLGEKPYSCPTCHKTFRRKDNLKQHQLIHSSKNPYQCPLCSESFRRQSQLRFHRVHAHGEKIHLQELQKRPKTVSTEKKRKTAQSGGCLCHYCGSSFKSKSALKEHESRIHLTRDRLLCDDCGKSFLQYSYLGIHMLNHLGIAPYQCSTCQECFSTSMQLRKHERSHSGELPFQCSTCGRLFREAGLLKMHMRTHTGDRPYVCPFCGKTFGHHSTLRSHKRIHTGDKPYRCDQCGIAFSQRSSLTYHMRSHRGERPYSCHVCGKSYTRMATLNIHLTRHTGQKRIACPLCDFTCDTPKHLRKHAAKAHQGAHVDPLKTQSSDNHHRPGAVYGTLNKDNAVKGKDASHKPDSCIHHPQPATDDGSAKTLAHAVLEVIPSYMNTNTTFAKTSYVNTLSSSGRDHDSSSAMIDTHLAPANGSNATIPTISEKSSDYMVNNYLTNVKPVSCAVDAPPYLNYSLPNIIPPNESLFSAPGMTFYGHEVWNSQPVQNSGSISHTASSQSLAPHTVQFQANTEMCNHSVPSCVRSTTGGPDFSNTVDTVTQNSQNLEAKVPLVMLYEDSYQQIQFGTYGINKTCGNNNESTAHQLSVSNEILYALNHDQTQREAAQMDLTQGSFEHATWRSHLENAPQIVQKEIENNERAVEEKKTVDLSQQNCSSEENTQWNDSCEAKRNESMLDGKDVPSETGHHLSTTEPTGNEDSTRATLESQNLVLEKSKSIESSTVETTTEKVEKIRRSSKKQWTLLLKGCKKSKASITKLKKITKIKRRTVGQGNAKSCYSKKNSNKQQHLQKNRVIKTKHIDQYKEEGWTGKQKEKRNNKGATSCPICGKTFTLAANLPKHMKLHSGERPYICSVCGCSFPRSDYLKNHMRAAHLHSEQVSLSCTQCGETFPSLRLLEEHVDDVHNGMRPFCCNLCNYSCLQLPDLKRHMKAKHLNKDPVLFECAICLAVFHKSVELKIHVTSIHQTSGKETKCNVDTLRGEGHVAIEQKNLEGKSDGDSFECSGGMVSSRNSSCPYKCGHCGQLYQNVSNLNSHMAKKHSGDKRFRCGICQSSYLAAHELGRHMLAHNGQRPFTCEQCGKAFPDWNQLRKHLVVHTDKKPYKCLQCGQAFKHRNTLRTHERIHSGSKPFKCKMCDAAFAQRASLKYHEGTHMGLKPYMCQICGNSYTRATTLNVHMNHHKGLRKLSCRLCEYMCDKPKLLHKHMAKVHPGECLDGQALRGPPSG